MEYLKEILADQIINVMLQFMIKMTCCIHIVFFVCGFDIKLTYYLFYNNINLSIFICEMIVQYS